MSNPEDNNSKGGEILCIIPGPSKVLAEEDAGVRWCFGCRKRLPHTDRLLADESWPNTWYEPVWSRECSKCGLDRTAFPGAEGWRW